jgi:hypothetical protein
MAGRKKISKNSWQPRNLKKETEWLLRLRLVFFKLKQVIFSSTQPVDWTIPPGSRRDFFLSNDDAEKVFVFSSFHPV